MDRLDIRILGQLYRGASSHGFQPEVRGVFGRISKVLDIDEDTIRKRVDRLKSAGVIGKWGLFLNPNVLGLKIGAVWMNVGPRLDIGETVRKIRLVHGVISISRLVGDVLSVGLFCENEEVLKRRVELIRELARPTGLETYLVNHPRTNVSLTHADWQIINALRPDPTISYVEVARRLGLSSKTVKRRLERLTQGNAIFFFPLINFTRLEGAFCVDLFVIYRDGRYKPEADRSIHTKFEEYVLRAGWGSQNHGHFEFVIPNISVAQEIVDWTRSLSGVKEVKLNFIFDSLNFYDDALDEVISGMVELKVPP